MADVEVKENSKKFLSAIQQEVERTMDMQSEEFKIDLWSIWKDLNDGLAKVFFSYFNEADISNDGYFYKEIMLDKPDTEFISAMFTANNMQAGQRLSLEVLCSEIVIYVPMHKGFAKMIEADSNAGKVFRDSQNNIVLQHLIHVDYITQIILMMRTLITVQNLFIRAILMRLLWWFLWLVILMKRKSENFIEMFLKTLISRFRYLWFITN